MYKYIYTHIYIYSINKFSYLLNTVTHTSQNKLTKPEYNMLSPFKIQISDSLRKHY